MIYFNISSLLCLKPLSTYKYDNWTVSGINYKPCLVNGVFESFL